MNLELEGSPGRATILYFQQFAGPRKGQEEIPSHSHNYGPRSEFFRLSWCGHCASRMAPGVMWATFPSLWGQFLYLFMLCAPHHWTLGWFSGGNAKEERIGFPKALLPHKSLPVQGGACKEQLMDSCFAQELLTWNCRVWVPHTLAEWILAILVPKPGSANPEPPGLTCPAQGCDLHGKLFWKWNYSGSGGSSSSGLLQCSGLGCQGKGCGTALSEEEFNLKAGFICRFLLCLSSLGRPCSALLSKHLCEMGTWSSHDIYSLIGEPLASSVPLRDEDLFYLSNSSTVLGIVLQLMCSSVE